MTDEGNGTTPDIVRGVSRVLAKLEVAMHNRNFYEAHQMYRTLYFRYLGQKNYTECLTLLYKGSLRMLASNESQSGADLALLFVDTLTKADKALDNREMWIERLGFLIENIGSTVVERETLIGRAIKWSATITDNKFGHPLMHKLIAQVLWDEGNVVQARKHLLASKDGIMYGQKLIELSESKGFPNEMDLFIAQVVLHLLCQKERDSALQTFETYTKYHPKIGRSEPPFHLPLLNFLYFLLNSIDAGNLFMLQKLTYMYRESLERDPAYMCDIRKIAQLFFGDTSQQEQTPPRTGGLFGNLFQILQGMMDAEEDDTTDNATNQTNQLNSDSTSTIENDLD